MSSTLVSRPDAAPTRAQIGDAGRPAPSLRERFARSERPLLLAGLLLVTVHLLDLALAGPQTWAVGIAAIVVLPLALAGAQPRLSRLTRFALAVPLGVLFAVSGSLAHVLDVVTSGPRWTDLTGIAFAIGGLLLIGAGCAALAAGPRRPRGASRGRRVAHGLGWLVGACVVVQFGFIPLVSAVVTTHAMRVPVDAGALSVPHSTVHVAFGDGDRLAGWYVPSRNGAAILVVHGSGGNRARVARHIELLAGAGYGVLAIDLPGHGESDGRANLLGANAQPALRAAVDWLARRPDVQPDRIGGLGTSLGGEVLLEAAARDDRLRAVVSDGAERASDDRQLRVEAGLARVVSGVTNEAIRAVSGTREAPPLVDLLPGIAPRQVLLIAGGGRPHEIAVNRAYQHAAGATARLWTLPEVGHTRGITARPTEYEHRVIAFLAEALRAR